MVRELKIANPGLKIFFIASARNAELLKSHLYLERDHYFSFSKIGEIFNFFRSYKIDTFVFLGGNPWICLWGRLAGVKKRMGLRSRWQSFIGLQRRLSIRQKRSDEKKSEYRWSLDLVYPLMRGHKSGKSPQHGISLGLKERIFFLGELALLVPKILEHPYAIVHPGMSGHTLNWPGESYARLIKILLADPSWAGTILLTYTSSDLPYIKGVQKYLRPHPNLVFLNTEKFGLKGYLAIASEAQFFVGPSTGTAHLASVAATARFLLYSPIKAQCSERWAPIFHLENQWVYTPNNSCPAKRTCLEEACSEFLDRENKCMRKIDPGAVASDIINYCLSEETKEAIPGTLSALIKRSRDGIKSPS